nr:L1 [Firstpapillomavirinae PV-HMU-2]
MALWLPSNNKVYLPPTAVSRAVSTEDYVTRTPYLYHASSERLLTVGNPFYTLGAGEKTIPKVSANQYRVFRVHLPDPNQFGLPDSDLYDPDSERLVWAVVGLEIGRGQPLGIGVSGHPLFNRFDDAENTGKYNPNQSTDNRQNICVDNKQTQLVILGCTPALGEHWAPAVPCDGDVSPGECPPLELRTSVLEDGNMIDTGFGAMDFKALQDSKSEVPLDIVQETCKYPDYLKMAADPYGDSLFFFIRREQLFTRHYFNRAGEVGEPIPDDLYFKATNSQSQNNLSPYVWFGTPSGSVVSTDTQVFNRPYWLQRAQGNNNGVCWNNQVFLTVVDTTRSTNFTISKAKTQSDTFKASDFKQYHRHVEEYELQFLFQLCKISLTPETMAYIHTMDPDVLDNWNIGLSVPSTARSEDTYRFLQNAASRCPDKVPPIEKVDPYDKYKFWVVDLSSRFSTDLSQSPLGRKFLLQTGLGATPRPLKRPARTAPSTTVKRRKRK